MLKWTGETEGETEQKRIRKKKAKKRDSETIEDVAVEPLPLPGSPVRGQKKSASSFFQKLREELQSAPAAPSEVPVTTAVSLSPPKNGSKLVEVVEFQSKSKKRKLKSDEDEPAKVMDASVALDWTWGPRASFRTKHLINDSQDLASYPSCGPKVAKPESSPEESGHYKPR
jgi:hypothetical protein